MTVNQIRYWENEEKKRANRATEAETRRSNVAREYETNRHNVTTEQESERHNKTTESINWQDASSRAIQARASQTSAQAAQKQALIAGTRETNEQNQRMYQRAYNAQVLQQAREEWAYKYGTQSANTLVSALGHILKFLA